MISVVRLVNSFLNRLTIVKDLFGFLWKEKVWWMIPIVIILLILAVVFILAQSPVIAPFVYTLF